ncbi:hypothetical protein THAOC_30379 [Thalassiosira oceanica]|uniref:Uncharacterized protein n=1 Tax=Thalassiosira oceanica TaxID=159749 RepID=K0RAB4_THAOC|nr:hypothetical protein THAOC_30379 [Thalassiosira oceanica]|eukprot:EJK50588.1 hypothetical protein THAOC_30379 [Thalassiosira oceanica]
MQKLGSRSRSGRSRQATGAEAEAAQFLPCGAVTLAGRAAGRLGGLGGVVSGVLEIDDGREQGARAAGDGRANDCVERQRKRR